MYSHLHKLWTKLIIILYPQQISARNFKFVLHDKEHRISVSICRNMISYSEILIVVALRVMPMCVLVGRVSRYTCCTRGCCCLETARSNLGYVLEISISISSSVSPSPVS